MSRAIGTKELLHLQFSVVDWKYALSRIRDGVLDWQSLRSFSLRLAMLPKIDSIRQKRPVRLARSLAVVWVVLALAETTVTYVCLKHAGNIEGNPFARSLLLRDEALFYGVKILVTMGVGLGFWLLATRTKHVKAMVTCQILLVAIFAAVLANNLLHL